MSKLTLARFNSSALRFEEAEAQVRQAWNSACNCPSPGERIECWDCPYYKHLGKLTQQKLHRTPEKVFAEIPPPEPLDPYSIEVKEQCCQMYRQGYSAEDIQKLVEFPVAVSSEAGCEKLDCLLVRLNILNRLNNGVWKCMLNDAALARLRRKRECQRTRLRIGQCTRGYRESGNTLMRGNRIV
jgi:hypothetical protein